MRAISQGPFSFLTERRPDAARILVEGLFISGRIAGEDPYMRVQHFVTDAFLDDPLGRKCTLLRLSHFSHDLKVAADVRYVPYPPVMLLRNDLDMPARLRIDIHECKECIIFIYFVRRKLAADNLTEYARLHVPEYTKDARKHPDPDPRPRYNESHMFPLYEPLPTKLRTALAAHDDLTAALLARRGITDKDAAARFLSPSYNDHLHDPLTMTDMPKAAQRLAAAIRDREHIAVWSDYDCDGIPGGVLLHDFLKKADADFENYIPHRHLEGYGVNVSGIESLAMRGTKLIVTVDSGITDHEAVARANELGMTVIVTDHHLPGETLPDAFAVVNPNAREWEPYPFKGLCGAGVAWKLVCAALVSERSLRERVPDGWEKWLLDMVGLATIADMVPLTGENRVLATYGLLVLRKSPRLGLQKLLRTMRVEQRTMTEDDVGFMLAPRVNAASRMGDPRDAFRLFTTEDQAEADALTKLLEKHNRERKAHAGAITRAARAKLKEKEVVRDVIVLGDPAWRPALLGLVANGIADEYERPVFLWGREENNTLKGSVRSADVVHALELMQAARSAFVDFGGHAASGGFTIKDDRVFDLERLLNDAFATLPKPGTDDTFVPHADAELTLPEISFALLRKLERLAPFGQENPKPVFFVREARLTSISRFGKGAEHVKAELACEETGLTHEAVAFFAKGRIARAADQVAGGARANILIHLERNAFSRKKPLRLRLLDLKLV